MNNFLKSKFVLLVILGLTSLGLAGCFHKTNNINQPATSLTVNSDSNVKAEPTITQAELEARYEAKLHDILNSDLATSDAASIKQQVLDLTVPTKYLDLHLKVVLDLDSLQQGQAAQSQTKIDQAVTDIEQLKSQYSWLN